MKILINDLPQVPNLSGSFTIVEPEKRLTTLREMIEKIKMKRLTFPIGDKDIVVRVNPETFAIEGLVDGEWRDVFPIVNQWLND